VSIIHSQGWGLGLDLEIFMDLYQGDLRTCIAIGDPYQYGPTLLKTMLEVLNFLTQKGVTHGEIKPANILFNQQGFYLTDFGLIGATCPTRGYALSELYAAPEAHREQPSTKSDIWSLGVVVLEILKKRPDFPPPQLLLDRRKLYCESIASATRETPSLGRMVSIDPMHRDDAETCLDRLCLRAHCGWPFVEILPADIEMAVAEMKQTKQKPSRVMKRPPKNKKRKGLVW
jgi:serine/threonine protein kinase